MLRRKSHILLCTAFSFIGSYLQFKRTSNHLFGDFSSDQQYFIFYHNADYFEIVEYLGGIKAILM